MELVFGHVFILPPKWNGVITSNLSHPMTVIDAFAREVISMLLSEYADVVGWEENPRQHLR